VQPRSPKVTTLTAQMSYRFFQLMKLNSHNTELQTGENNFFCHDLNDNKAVMSLYFVVVLTALK
jgi:hypothetical protein